MWLLNPAVPAKAQLGGAPFSPSLDHWPQADPEVHFRLLGAGQPLVLVHSLGSGGAIWDQIAATLSSRFQVITYDARGHALKEWSGPDFTIEECAADLIGLLDHLSVDRAHVWGMSMGGSIALCCAGLYPERISGLVLSGTTAWYGADAQAYWSDRAERILATSRESQFESQLGYWFTPGFAASNPAELNRIRSIYIKTSNAGHAAACRALGRLDARALLADIEAPTLVMTGDRDSRTPWQMGQALADVIPKSRFELLADLAHLGPLESPKPLELATKHLLGGQT